MNADVSPDQHHTDHDPPPILIEEEEVIPWSFLRMYCRYFVPRTQEEMENLELILEWMRSRGYGSKTDDYDEAMNRLERIKSEKSW